MNSVKQLFNYFNGLMRTPRQKNALYAPVVAGWLMMVLNANFGIYGSRDFATVILAGLAGLLFLAAAAIGMQVNNKPNIATLMPLNRKKSLLFRFVSVFMLYIMVIVILVAFIFAVVMITFLFTLLIEGGIGDITTDDEPIPSEYVNAMGVYGGLFMGAYAIIMYASGMISGFIQRRKYRNIYLICLLGAILLSFLLMGIPAVTAGKSMISPFAEVCYECMSLPWLAVAAWWLIAAAMLGTAIYMGVKQYGQKF